MSKKNGVLITRTDRIGDLILSLPAFKTFKTVFPDRPLHLMVSSYAAPLLDYLPGIASVIRYDSVDKKLVQQIKDLECSSALMLYYDAEVLNVIKKAGIKQRFGPLTKISAIFSYSKWMSQHRSRVEQHELEYNMELLKLLGVSEQYFDYTLELPVPKALYEIASGKLKSIGFENPDSGYIVIHPGMGGSALNWKYAYYAELGSRLYDYIKLPIVVTGSASESNITSSIAKHISGVAYDTSKLFSLQELMGLISKAKLFIGPSTGPMHIAAATSVPVVSIFSPVKVQSARRWGPYSNDAITISPDVDCPGKLECLGSKCEHYLCMDSISVDSVFDRAKKVFDGTVHQMSLGL